MRLNCSIIPFKTVDYICALFYYNERQCCALCVSLSLSQSNNAIMEEPTFDMLEDGRPFLFTVLLIS